MYLCNIHGSCLYEIKLSMVSIQKLIPGRKASKKIASLARRVIRNSNARTGKLYEQRDFGSKRNQQPSTP